MNNKHTRQMKNIVVISVHKYGVFWMDSKSSRLGNIMTKFMTVVVAINDENVFERKRKEIFDSWRTFDLEDTDQAFGVCAISECNELARLEHINQSVDCLQDLIAQNFEHDGCEHYLSPQLSKKRST